MPIIKSAKKRARQTEKRHALNLTFKRNLHSTIKQFEAAIASKDRAKARKLLPQLQSAIDIAVKKNLMHKNKAARQKSLFVSRLKAIDKKIPTHTRAKKSATAKTAPKK